MGLIQRFCGWVALLWQKVKGRRHNDFWSQPHFDGEMTVTYKNARNFPVETKGGRV